METAEDMPKTPQAPTPIAPPSMERTPPPVPERKPSLGSEYSLTEKELVHAKRFQAEITLAHSANSQTTARLENLKAELEAAERELKARREYIDLVIARSNGWADAVAMTREDDKPSGFTIDYQQGRIVRMKNDASMG